MEKKTVRLLSILLGIVMISSLSKAQIGLRADSVFFKKQINAYQNWLDKSSIGELVELDELELTDHKIKVHLIAREGKKVQFISYWKQWKKEFSQQNPITLEQRLFYKLHHFLETEQNQIELFLYDIRLKFCHRIKISFFDGQVQVSKQSCRAKERHIEVSPASFFEGNAMSYEEIQKKFTRALVFKSILSYSNEKYGASKCELRYPNVQVLETGEVLRFVVTDLCKEVLIDESDPWICKVLKKWGHLCNWIKREKLEFLITFQNIPRGIKIGVQIDGKYGSGYFDHVKRGGYHLMDNDFDEYLEEYADKMKTEFKNIILSIND